MINCRSPEEENCGMCFHLQNPGSESVIQQDVKAQNLKAGTAGGVVGEARVVIMLEDGMSRDQSLYDHILNVCPHLFSVATQWLQELVQGGQFSGDQNRWQR